MKYESKLSTLRHLALKVQGLDLKQVLLRAAAKKAEFIAHEVHSAEEIFHELKQGIYKYTNELPMDECYNIVADVDSLNKLKTELIDKPSQNFQWAETLHVLLDNTEGTERKILETVLNNQYHYIKESEEYSSNGQLYAFNKLLPLITRRVFKNFEAGKLVGVQPMNMPCSIAYLLRFVHEERKEDLEGTAGRRMTLNVVGEAHEARTQRLAAAWALEPTQDLYSMNGIDVECEMIQAISSEIQTEISVKIVSDLRHLAGEPMEITLDSKDDEAQLKLSCHINRACNDIAAKTRRGAGNWMIVSHTALSIIEDLPNYVKTTTTSGLYGSLMEVGILNETIKVFSSLHMNHDEILVGYKGHSGATDTGYVYCPYVPVLPAGVVVHPETFQPRVSLMTRAGRALNGTRQFDEEGNEVSEELLTVAEDYYNLIKVKGDLFTKKETTDEEA